MDEQTADTLNRLLWALANKADETAAKAVVRRLARKLADIDVPETNGLSAQVYARIVLAQCVEMLEADNG